jgi:hypothetical protein
MRNAFLSLLACLLLVGQSFASPQSDAAAALAITPANALAWAAVDAVPPVPYPAQEPQAVVVKFTGENCQPCQRLAPKLKAATPANYKVWEFVAENPAHAKWFRDWNVTQFPTVFIMSPDGYTLATIVGDKSEEELRSAFAQAANKLTAKKFTSNCEGLSCAGPATCGAGGSCSACPTCQAARATTAKSIPATYTLKLSADGKTWYYEQTGTVFTGTACASGNCR